LRGRSGAGRESQELGATAPAPVVGAVLCLSTSYIKECVIIKPMKNKDFSLAAAIVFSFATIIHALRIINGWEAVIGGWAVPMWVSWLVVIIVGPLAYQGFKLSKKG
jgi:hypothetical protein